MTNEWTTIKSLVQKKSTSRSTRERNGLILLARKIKARTAEGRWMKNPVWPSSCVTPAGTSTELDVQNEWEENTTTKHKWRVHEHLFFCSYVARCSPNRSPHMPFIFIYFFDGGLMIGELIF